MLPIKKIYVDSRHRTPDSVDGSNFKIQLPYTIQLPENTVFFVTDICIPHVWNLIEPGVNDKLYFTYRYLWSHASDAYRQYYASITLPSGEYDGPTLASTVQTLMNEATASTNIISFVVSWTNNGIFITCVDRGNGSHEDLGFNFYTDEELSQQYIAINFAGLKLGNPTSANDIFNIHTPVYFKSSFSSGFMSLQPFHNVYLTSPNFGSFDTISSFSNNVIKKIPITVPFGYMIIDQYSSDNDYLNCSGQTIRTIEFHLKDSRGRYILMKNQNVSFSIVFNKFNLGT